MGVRVFVDSSADIYGKIAEETGIIKVPLSVHFGDAVYEDGVDLTPDAFYQLLITSHDLPNTSQPSPGDFLNAYRRHSEPGDTIFSFHLSSKLSGTYQSALLASRQIDDRDVRVIDTRSASLGVAMPAIMATRWATAGNSVESIERRTQAMIQNQSVYFLVDTLDYLHRHGRIGKAQALFGSLLQIKPVLTLDDGVVAPAEKVRGQNRAIARLLELVKSKFTPADQLLISVIDAQVPDVANQLLSDLQVSFPRAEFLRTTLGPIIGTHTGPGTLGVITNIIPAE